MMDFLVDAFSANQNNRLADGIAQEGDCILKQKAKYIK